MHGEDEALVDGDVQVADCDAPLEEEQIPAARLNVRAEGLAGERSAAVVDVAAAAEPAFAGQARDELAHRFLQHHLRAVGVAVLQAAAHRQLGLRRHGNHQRLREEHRERAGQLGPAPRGARLLEKRVDARPHPAVFDDGQIRGVKMRE